ncbi:MAG: Gfo/Idh/MocA family protein [Promethearchaeota archaeon]
MKDKYKVIVIGMGKRGGHHATYFHANDHFDLAGICDIDEKRLEEWSKKLNNPQTNTDAAHLVKVIKPDVFCFTTPPNLRLEMIKMGIDSGAQLIAFEKPISMSSKEAMEIKKLIDKSGIRAVVSHQHRYGTHYQKVREIIASGALGRIQTVYGTATGWMMHMLTHLIDYIRWFNNNIDAEWVIGQASGKSKFADIHTSPDYIAGFIHFSNGVRGIVECGAGAPDVPEVDYWWRKNRIGAQGTEGFAEVLTGGGWRAVTKDGTASGEGNMNYDLDMPPYIQEIADWLDDDDKIHQCNFESAYKGFDIMMGLCRSIVEGGQISLPLTVGKEELKAMQEAMPDKKVLYSFPEMEKEYPS